LKPRPFLILAQLPEKFRVCVGESLESHVQIVTRSEGPSESSPGTT
jgi:hypothetical protein